MTNHKHAKPLLTHTISKTVSLLFISLLAISATMFTAQASEEATAKSTSLVEMKTSAGRIVIELDDQKAPTTVENFLAYVNDGFYNGTIFHRVIDGFMIQGGGFTADFQQKKTRAPIQNEANNGLKNDRFTISMARTNAPHSATAQFFINTVDNTPLDYTASTQRGWGYAVFGRIIEGFEVVESISSTVTGPGGPFARDTPKETITIENVSVMTQEAPAEPAAEEKTE